MSYRVAVAILAFWITANVTIVYAFVYAFAPHMAEQFERLGFVAALIGTLAGAVWALRVLLGWGA